MSNVIRHDQVQHIIFDDLTDQDKVLEAKVEAGKFIV